MIYLPVISYFMFKEGKEKATRTIIYTVCGLDLTG